MATINNSTNYQPTQYNVQSGGANNLLNNIAPSTAGFVLTSQGASLQPAFLQSTMLSGWISWGGAGNYFDDTVIGSFTISRPGTGYIKNVVTSWTAPQTITGLTAGVAWLIYIDSSGTIQKAASESDSLYTDQILLFQCLRDSTSGTNIQWTTKENHPATFPATVAIYCEDTIGTVLASNESGGVITANGTLKIQINGANTLIDSGLQTVIPDSGGVAVSFRQYFTNAGGKWCQYTVSDTFGAFYNAAGTVTALSANKFGVYTLYVAKDNITSSSPIYIAVLDVTQYNTATAATNAISAGTVALATNELANMEIAQLGFIVFGQTANAITNIVVAKKIIATSTSTSSGSTITTVQYNVLTGDAGNTVNNVPPSATSGVPLISQGAAAQPVFGTAVVAGGGTGNTTFTAYSVICAGTTATGAFQNVSGLGTATHVLTSNGAGALPTWQAPGAASAGTITGDSGGALSQTTGNWNLLGTANQITTTGATSTLTFSLPSAITAPGSLTTTTTLTATTLFKASAGQQVNITTPGAYPYTTLITDFVILVDSSAARTITPLGSPATGQMYRIKDNAGTASLFNITITPSGKNIDGVASYVINTNYGSVDIVYNGTQWNLL